MIDGELVVRRDKEAQKEYLKYEREDRRLKTRNDVVRAFSRSHRLKIEVLGDGNLVIPCHGPPDRHGYWALNNSFEEVEEGTDTWAIVGPPIWVFFHPYRKYPHNDIQTLLAIEPRLQVIVPLHEELYLRAPEQDVVLKVMLLDEPEFSSARRMRPPTTITPDRLAAMAAGRARKASQALQNPENPFSSGTGASPPTSGTSSPPTPPSRGETALEGLVAPIPVKSPDKERRPS